jgi:hypothetical protein
MSQWGLVAVPALQAHVAAASLVPLDAHRRGESGGPWRWHWPWTSGDGGLPGRITPATGSPLAGFALTPTAAGGELLLLAALAAAGVGVPAAWWQERAVAGAALLLYFMALFLGPTKLLPMAAAPGTRYLAVCAPTVFATDGAAMARAGAAARR